MARSFNKEVVRSITQSAGRFAAIAIISLLGAGFYAGLRMAAPDMRLAGDEYYDGTGLYDVSVVSTLGLDDQSVALLREVDGVGAVMPAYRADSMVRAGENSYAATIESLPIEAARASNTSDGVHSVSFDPAYLNRPILEQGDWPDAAATCVVGIDAAREFGIAIGDVLTIQESDAAPSSLQDSADSETEPGATTGDADSVGDKGDSSKGIDVDVDVDVDIDAEGEDEPTFDKTELVVVGYVNSPLYSSSSMLGATSLGTGEVELYLYVPEQAFNQELPYSIAYLSVPAAQDEAWDYPDYDECVQQVKDAVAQKAPAVAQARYDAVVTEAQGKLDDARQEYQDARADAEAKLADAKDELDDAKAELDDAQADLADARADMDDGRVDLAKARDKLQDAHSQLEDSRKKLDDTRTQLNEAYDQLQETYKMLEQMRKGIESGVADDEKTRATYAATLAEYEKGLAEYEAGLKQYNAGLAQYEAGVAEYKKGKQSYEKGLADYQSGVTKYNDGVAEYEDGVAEYNDGVSEYEDGLAKAQEKFADAEQKLADAQAEIDDIEFPDVYVLDRSKNAGAASLSSDSKGIDQIALFLPFMFFLVAALVSLTSMTRMVEEERLVIGTHKALGYGKARITSKYLIYGALASGLGSIVGVVALGKLLPWFILVSYGVSYAIPLYPTPIHAAIAVRAVGLSVAITLGATLWAAASALRETPAALMLPRVPKAGKRIVLERIRPLWARMSFSQKVTARNLLRYKRRFFMAVVGVAGCTALLMIGFGLRDAIGGIVDNQYQELISYDAAVRINDDADDAQRQAFQDALGASDVEASLLVSDFNLIAEGPGDDLRIEVVVPTDPSRLPDFVTLRDRASGQAIALEGAGVVLTEKAADVLGVAAGDTLTLFDENDVGDKQGDGRSFVVAGVTENYLGHFAYLLPEGYQQAFGEEPVFGLALVKLAGDAGPDAFSDRLLALQGVDTVSFVSQKILTYEGMLDVMNKLIYVIMLLSAALAFVVLYNLTNINITERVREIATLKVLGFTHGEVNAYIFREVLVMALIGALLGCVLGVPLTFYIARAAETANMMFGRTIEPASFVLSFVLTMVFALIVMFTMRRKLYRVNMVESLKSVE